MYVRFVFFFFFSSRRRHTRCSRDWSSDVCSSDLGDFLVRVKGDAQSATEDYEKARKLQPRAAVLAERLAQAYQSRGEMNQAKQAAREALALDPRRLVALRLLASIAMSERDYPGALEFLNKMLAMRSNDAWVRVEKIGRASCRERV